jgi:choline dehydrogenase-like flavoprotein
VIEHWHAHCGVRGLTAAALRPHFERIEQRLSVTPMKLEQINANNRVIWRGAEALGWSKHLLHRNVKHCAHTGYCGMGCPIDAKQSMLVTMIPDAVRAGADVYATLWVESVRRQGRRATEVIGRVRDPKTDRFSGRQLRVRAKLVVLAGGGINTPAILLRSELNANGRAGKRTFLHPTVGVVGFHAERIEGFHGSPQYVACDEFSFARRGSEQMSFLIEAAPVFPMGLGAAGPSFGAELQQDADRLAHVSVTIALLHDGFDRHDADEGGSVTLRDDGSPKLAYKWSERLQQGLRRATKHVALIQLKGGAESVVSLHAPRLSIDSPGELKRLDDASYAPLQMAVFSAHVMGGCAMGHDPKTSVVDSANLRHHELDNLFVIDGSVLPTSLTVNPQLSIYGLASWASEHLKQAL